MTWQIWATYVGTVLVLMSTPGPSQLLMLSNSATHGFRRSIATASGDLTANLLQMLAAGFGLAAVLASSQSLFVVIKWLGVSYLLWLGLRAIRRSGRTDPRSAARTASLRTLWLQGFITSAANPKAVVFFAALFPQFIDQGAPLGPQLAVLSVTYLAIDAGFLTAYGAGAGWISARLGGSARAWIDRVAGGCLIGAAVLLGLRSARQDM